MDHEADSSGSRPPRPSGDDEIADPAAKGVCRKLRYDAPSLAVPRPLYLRSNGPEPDEGAA